MAHLTPFVNFTEIYGHNPLPLSPFKEFPPNPDNCTDYRW